MISKDRVAFFGIEGDPFSDAAADHLRGLFAEVQTHLGNNEVPPRAGDPGVLDVDWLFSFKTKTIFRAHTIEAVRHGALNFHTASPVYPGSGGVNWVLYNDDPTSAITVHEITTSVDAGTILCVDTFARDGADSVASLLKLTYENHLATFQNVTSEIAKEGAGWLAHAREAGAGHTWGPKTYRLRDLEDLKQISPDMPAEEVTRRIRATSYGRYGPYILLHGHKFQLAEAGDHAD